jgi:hypothetical protein
MSDNNSKQPALAAIGDAAKAAGLIVGVLYVIGLLVVNVDLARYGVVKVDLARPEYAMAGALWVVLSACALGALYLVRQAWRSFRSEPSARSLGILAAEIAPIFGGLSYILWVLSNNRVSIYTARGRFVLGFLIAQSLLVSLAALSGRRFVGGLDAFAKLFSGGSAGLLFHLIWDAVSIIAALGLYATQVFPEFPREFGGGQKPLVRLVLPNAAQVPWSAAGISLSANGKEVGPVRLLMETSDSVVVCRDEAHNSSGQASAVVVSRSLVSAILFVLPVPYPPKALEAPSASRVPRTPTPSGARPTY